MKSLKKCQHDFQVTEIIIPDSGVRAVLWTVQILSESCKCEHISFAFRIHLPIRQRQWCRSPKNSSSSHWLSWCWVFTAVSVWETWGILSRLCFESYESIWKERVKTFALCFSYSCWNSVCLFVIRFSVGGKHVVCCTYQTRAECSWKDNL